MCAKQTTKNQKAVIEGGRSRPLPPASSFPTEDPASAEFIRDNIRQRNDLIVHKEHSIRGLEVIQLTSNPAMASHTIYPEAHACTPDSKRVVFSRTCASGKSAGNFWLLDIENDFALRQITDEAGAHSVAVSPDAKWMYYLVNQPQAPHPVVKLKRLSLDDFSRQTLLTVDDVLPGTTYRATHYYGLASIASDGKKLCTSVFLGDGKTDMAPFGLIVFDLEAPSVKLVFAGPEYSNMHIQYCRSLEHPLSRDILIQHNHGYRYDKTGSFVFRKGKLMGVKGEGGADLHVVRDDGTHWRDVPLGRDGAHLCTGHQLWRGRGGSVLSAMISNAGRATQEEHIYEAWPLTVDEHNAHRGMNIPGGRYRNHTQGSLPRAHFSHFNGDLSGQHLVMRHTPGFTNTRTELFLASLPDNANDKTRVRYLLSQENMNYIASARSLPRPFFSPDSRMIFFHSNPDNCPSQIFLARGYTFP